MTWHPTRNKEMKQSNCDSLCYLKAKKDAPFGRKSLFVQKKFNLYRKRSICTEKVNLYKENSICTKKIYLYNSSNSAHYHFSIFSSCIMIRHFTSFLHCKSHDHFQTTDQSYGGTLTDVTNQNLASDSNKNKPPLPTEVLISSLPPNPFVDSGNSSCSVYLSFVVLLGPVFIKHCVK